MLFTSLLEGASLVVVQFPDDNKIMRPSSTAVIGILICFDQIQEIENVTFGEGR